MAAPAGSCRSTTRTSRLALLTLGTGGETGLNKTGNRPLKIKGSVYVNSSIHADDTGTLCSGDVASSSNSTNCNGIYVTGPNSNPDNVRITARMAASAP